MTSAWKTQIRSDGDAGEHEDAVRVDEPVAEVHELAGEEPVAREHGGQPREALVRRVRGQDEDAEGEPLDEVVEDRAPADDAGKVARAISERSETLSLGRAPISTASYETPRKSVIAITPMTNERPGRVLRPRGGRKALTPFEIASTPVSARRRRRRRAATTRTPTAPTPAASGSGVVRHAGSCRRGTYPTPVATSDVHDGDERVGREGEEDAGLADAAEVHERSGRRRRASESSTL